MDFENLDISPELREKAKACKTPEEIMALAKKRATSFPRTSLRLCQVARGGQYLKTANAKPTMIFNSSSLGWGCIKRLARGHFRLSITIAAAS